MVAPTFRQHLGMLPNNCATLARSYSTCVWKSSMGKEDQSLSPVPPSPWHSKSESF